MSPNELLRSINLSVIFLLVMKTRIAFSNNSSVRERFEIKWIVEAYPLNGTNWTVSFILPIDFAVDYMIMTCPNNMHLKYCSPITSRSCDEERVNADRISVESTQFILKTKLTNISIEDSGIYNWTIMILGKHLYANEHKYIAVRQSPAILQFISLPSNISKLFEGQSIYFLCEVDAGHIADISILSLHNNKFVEVTNLDVFNNSRELTRQSLVITLNSTFEVVEGDSFVECNSVNKFGDKAIRRIWLVVLVNDKIKSGSDLTIFCFTDFRSVDLKFLNYTVERCMKDSVLMEFLPGFSRFTKLRYSRYFTLTTLNTTVADSGFYACQVEMCFKHFINCTIKQSCERSITVFRSMNLTYCDVSDAPEAGEFAWLMVIAFPGEYWSRSYVRIFIHDLPETWRFQPPLSDKIKLNSSILIVNITFSLPTEPKGYSLLRLCCDLVNNDNLPSIMSSCVEKSVIHRISGSLYTIPFIPPNGRVKVNMRIRCTGAFGVPVPVYRWNRLSNNRKPFQIEVIPDITTSGEWLIVDNRSRIRGNIYEYRCLASQFGLSLQMDIQFIVNLCAHEPLIDLSFALNTQIHTICGINNTQGTEFFTVAYKPLLQRLVMALPITPKKTRISFVPFLNYKSRHNATYLPFTNSLNRSQISQFLDFFASQYSSPLSKPCDGMELSCSGQGFHNVHEAQQRLRKSIPAIAIVGRDVSACVDYMDDKVDMERYSKLLKTDGFKVWLHYFSKDVSILEDEERLIKPDRTFILVNDSMSHGDLDFCCDMSRHASVFSVTGIRFFEEICEASSTSQDPLQNPILNVTPPIIYPGLRVEISCRGNPGFPNGSLSLCLVPELLSSCIIPLSVMTSRLPNNEIAIRSSLELVPEYDKWYILCVATNEVQTQDYDNPFTTSFLIRYLFLPMTYIFINIVPDSITEGNHVYFNCSFNLPIPPPIVTISLQKTGLQNWIVYSNRIRPNLTDLSTFKQQSLLQIVTVRVESISNEWDEATAMCAMATDVDIMSAQKSLLIQWTMVRQPSLTFTSGSNYDMRHHNITPNFILQAGNWIVANCSAKVGNANNSLKLIVHRSTDEISVINDHNECHSVGIASENRGSQYKCSEIRRFTRNENYREVLFAIAKISSEDQWLNFTCVANNSLNRLSEFAGFKVFLDAKINWMKLVTTRKISCNASGNPEVELNLNIISSNPPDIANQIQDLPVTIIRTLNTVIGSIEVPNFIKGLLVIRCTARNYVNELRKIVFYEQSFFFLDTSYRPPNLQIVPVLATTSTVVQFTCFLNVDLFDSIRYVMIYQLISTVISKIQMFPVVARRVQGADIFTFSLWQDMQIINNTIAVSSPNTSWNVAFIPISRWMSGLYHCVVIYEGGARETTAPPRELRVADKPSRPILLIKSKGREIKEVIENQIFSVVCAVNVGLVEEKGSAVLMRNESQIREDHYNASLEPDATQNIIISKFEKATKQVHLSAVYTCVATNIIGSHDWKTPPLRMLYSPSLITFRLPDQRHVLRNNESIECVADANPIAKVYWQISVGPLGNREKYLTDTLYYVKGNVLYLTGVKSGLYSFSCYAENYLGKTFRTLTVFVTATQDTKYFMDYSPSYPIVGNYLSFFCLSFHESDYASSLSDLLISLSWFKFTPNSQNQILLVSYSFVTHLVEYHASRERFFMGGPSRNFRLDILNVKIGDFGRYGCKVKLISNDTVTMLTRKEICIIEPPQEPEIIIDKSETCFGEGDSLRIICNSESGRLICGKEIRRFSWLVLNISYHPKGRPQFDEYHYLHIINDTANKVVFLSGSHMWYSLSIDQNEAVAHCSLNGNFTDHETFSTSWPALWQENIINNNMKSFLNSRYLNICVLFAPRSIFVEPPTDKVYPGTRISCTALANPAPFVHWHTNYDWDKESGINVGFLAIPLNISSGVYKAVCYATNFIHGVNNTVDLPVDIVVKLVAERRWSRLILLIMGITLLVLFIGILVCLAAWFMGYCCFRPYRDESEYSEESDISVAPIDYAPYISGKDVAEIITYNNLYEEEYEDDCREPPEMDVPFLTSYPSWKIVKDRNFGRLDSDEF